MNSWKITSVEAREVFSALYIPTVEVTVEVGGTLTASAIAPMGQSTGTEEAGEVRDGGERFEGAGCLTAVSNVNTEIRNLLVGMDVTRQREIDNSMDALDGTGNKSRIGANAIVATSVAVAKAAAKAVGLPLYRYLNSNARILPVPLFSVVDGGHYAFGQSSEIQEFNIFPVGAQSMAEAVALSRQVYNTLSRRVAERFGPLAQCVNTAGGFSLPIRSCRDTFDFLLSALEGSGAGDKFVLGMDCAASHWYDREQKLYRFEDALRSREEMLDYYKKLVRDYPIVTMEDPFDETDVEGFILATKELGVQIVGDDFFVTNKRIMKEKMQQGAANALLWKYNQVGTLSEAFDAAALAVSCDYGVMTSERSGESEDTVLSDLTVALNAGQIKTGICVRSEHTAKYNRLMQIEGELGAEAIYAGYNYKNPNLL